MTEKELARGAADRLAILRHAEEVSGNVAKTCRYHGIPQTFYKMGPPLSRGRCRRLARPFPSAAEQPQGHQH